MVSVLKIDFEFVLHGFKSKNWSYMRNHKNKSEFWGRGGIASNN